MLESHEALRVDPPALPAQSRDDDTPVSEQDKIRQLIQRVRTSGVVFIRNGREQSSAEAAAHLQSVHGKGDPSESAVEFIARVANKTAATGHPYQVRQGDAAPIAAHAWLRRLLQDIESGGEDPVDENPADEPPATPPAPVDHVRAQGPAATAREITINDVLTIVESSGCDFAAPQRKKEAKSYGAMAFSQMLRQKWQWLGRDITEIDEFLSEIATSAFSSLEPYRVRCPGQPEETLRPWLERKIEEKRHARAEVETKP